MIWSDGSCQISRDLKATIVPWPKGWTAAIWGAGEDAIWWEDAATEDAAKAAVAHWIGRTMAQFSNALAQGFEQPDDGA